MRTPRLRLVAAAGTLGLLLAACTGDASGGDRELAVANVIEAFDLAGTGSEADAAAVANCIIDAFGEDRLGDVDNFDPDFEPDAETSNALASDVTAALTECVGSLGGGLSPSDGESTGDEPMAYGDDAELDALWDECAETGASACDELFFTSPVNSDYEEFGNTCGDRGIELSCDEAYGDGTGPDDAEPIDCDSADIEGPCDYGDDEALDALWDGCEAGDGAACDDLFDESPIGSRYEQFGNTCGDRGFEPSCAEVYTN